MYNSDHFEHLNCGESRFLIWSTFSKEAAYSERSSSPPHFVTIRGAIFLGDIDPISLSGVKVGAAAETRARAKTVNFFFADVRESQHD